MPDVTFRIWRGDAEQGEFRDYTTEVADGMVVLNAIRSRSLMVWVTPFRNSCRPLMIADRVGAHVGLTWKSVNRVDRR